MLSVIPIYTNNKLHFRVEFESKLYTNFLQRKLGKSKGNTNNGERIGFLAFGNSFLLVLCDSVPSTLGLGSGRD